MFQKLFVNFWVWWYAVELKNISKNLLRFWLYTLGTLNVIPMLQNLTKPLYQDYSAVGRLIGLMIRTSWIFFGTLIQFIVTVPIIGIFLVSIIMPFIPIIMIISIFFYI